MLNKVIKAFEREFIGQPKEWYPVKDTIYYGRMSDAEIEAMRQRNEEAIQKCIKDMGTKWLLHPVHKVFRNVSQ
jgi:hypothetical protein